MGFDLFKPQISQILVKMTLKWKSLGSQDDILKIVLMRESKQFKYKQYKSFVRHFFSAFKLLKPTVRPLWGPKMLFSEFQLFFNSFFSRNLSKSYKKVPKSSESFLASKNIPKTYWDQRDLRSTNKLKILLQGYFLSIFCDLMMKSSFKRQF